MEDASASCDFFSCNILALPFDSHHLERGSIACGCQLISMSNISKTTDRVARSGVQCRSESMQEKKANSPVSSSFIFAWFWSLPHWDLWQLCVYITTPTVPSHLAQVGFEEPNRKTLKES